MPTTSKKNKQQALSLKTSKPWFVYILLCDDDSLYTGITTNLNDRLLKHQRGMGAKYTRGRGAKKIVFSEQHAIRSEALIREAEIKKLPRNEKVLLIKEINLN